MWPFQTKFLFFKFLYNFIQISGVNERTLDLYLVISAVPPSKGIHFWHLLEGLFWRRQEWECPWHTSTVSCRGNLTQVNPSTDVILILKLWYSSDTTTAHLPRSGNWTQGQTTCRLAGALWGSLAQNLCQNRDNGD